jgi:hypothetical protein
MASELAKLGYAVDKNTVAKYMPKPAQRPRHPPSQTWKTFLRNHLAGTIAIDFLTVPTVTFNVLYVFFVLSLERRRVLHVNVTAHPYATWGAQQIVEAMGAQIVPARLIRDCDAIFGTEFDARVNNLGVRQIRISPRSPWKNGYVERWVGPLRRELLDHVIVLGGGRRVRRCEFWRATGCRRSDSSRSFSQKHHAAGRARRPCAGYSATDQCQLTRSRQTILRRIPHLKVLVKHGPIRRNGGRECIPFVRLRRPLHADENGRGRSLAPTCERLAQHPVIYKWSRPR